MTQLISHGHTYKLKISFKKATHISKPIFMPFIKLSVHFRGIG